MGVPRDIERLQSQADSPISEEHRVVGGCDAHLERRSLVPRLGRRELDLGRGNEGTGDLEVAEAQPHNRVPGARGVIVRELEIDPRNVSRHRAMLDLS